jgi:hypothetical protein
MMQGISSSDIVNEVFQSLMLDQLEDAVILSALVIVVVLLELRPLTLGLLLVYSLNEWYYNEIISYLSPWLGHKSPQEVRNAG